MANYMLRRLISTLPVALLLVFMVVALVRVVPGDPIDALYGGEDGGGVSEAQRTRLEEELGLNDPLPLVYINYVSDLVRGDLGRSIASNKPIAGVLANRAPLTIQLTFMAMVVSLLIALPIGILAAVRRNSARDYFFRGAAVLVESIPNFALATLVVVIPANIWGWIPPFYTSFTDDPLGNLWFMFIPSLVLGAALAGSTMRMTRTSLIEVVNEDYIRTAYAKGLSERTTIARHALRNSLIPVVGILGIQIAALLSGTVVVESIFSIPGVGRELLQAVSNRDYPLIQAITVMVGLSVLLLNSVVDFVYVWLDPRIRL